MNTSSLVLAAVIVSAAVSTIEAQTADVDPRCRDAAFVGSGLEGGDACQKAIDLFNYMTPQLGTLIAGGNATLGQGGTLGGPGHFTISVRANGMRAGLPDIQAAGVSRGPARSDNYTVEERWAGLPVVDAAVGVFRGIPLPFSNVGGVDLLANVSYLPEFSHDPISVLTPNGSFKLGYGVRLGILQETIITPGISVTWMKRDMPRTLLVASWDDGVFAEPDSVTLDNFAIETRAWRIVASKSLMVFGIAAGVGQDTYESSSDLSYVVNGTLEEYRSPRPLDFGNDVKRTNMFLDLSANLPALKIVGQIGRVSGGSIETHNSFSTEADAARWYGAVGVRFGR